MRVIIVGNGPSLLMNSLGSYIDGFDCVIRLKRCQDLLKHARQFGTKTDIVAGSFNIAPALKGIGKAPVYFIIMDSRHRDVDSFKVKGLVDDFAKDNYTAICDVGLCEWVDVSYNVMKDAMEEIGHPHTSQGTKAIVYALDYIRPEVLELVGFDNVSTGDFTWSITRGPHWKHYPDHNWKVENALMSAWASRYRTPIKVRKPDGSCWEINP